MATKYKDNLELIYHNKDWEGNTLQVWKGKSLKRYPEYIANGDAVFYMETNGLYRFTLKDQIMLEGLVLSIVVVPERRNEKANLFINEANKYKSVASSHSNKEEEGPWILTNYIKKKKEE
uniref:Uncharacterized protein n=1 Tax=viral metagenome TaxID=1070528 RepID=A0A6M3KTH5_9ZZZZ